MKKIISLVLAVALVLGSYAMVFASEIVPFYIGTARHTELLSISKSGSADFGAELIPKQETSFDRVTITLELVYEDNGSTVYKVVANTTYDTVKSSFEKYVDDYQLDDKGDYRLFVTYKCYKNGSLIETITMNVTDTY